MKLKSYKSAIKRIHQTRRGKFLRRRMLSQHLVVNKSRRARKNAGRKILLSPANLKLLKKII